MGQLNNDSGDDEPNKDREDANDSCDDGEGGDEIEDAGGNDGDTIARRPVTLSSLRWPSNPRLLQPHCSTDQSVHTFSHTSSCLNQCFNIGGTL